MVRLAAPAVAIGAALELAAADVLSTTHTSSVRFHSFLWAFFLISARALLRREEQAPPRDQRAGRRQQQSHDRYRAPCFARTWRSSAPASEQWMDTGRLQKRIFKR